MDRGGNPSCRAQPVDRDSNPSCRAQPVDRGGNPSCRAQPEDRGGNPSCRAQPVDRGGNPSCRAQPVDRGSNPSCRAQPVDRGGNHSRQAQPVDRGGNHSRQAQPVDRGGNPSGVAGLQAWEDEKLTHIKGTFRVENKDLRLIRHLSASRSVSIVIYDRHNSSELDGQLLFSALYTLSYVDTAFKDTRTIPWSSVTTKYIVQSFYHKKRVTLGLIARGFSNVSYIKKCALQHTKSLKKSD